MINIAFLYNVKKVAPSLENPEADIYAEFDSPETIAGIRKAIEANNHKVICVEADEYAYHKLKELKDNKKVDLVFNIAEGLRGESRESHIPAMLEMLGIPYTGSGPLTLAVTLDKARTKEILNHYNIPNAKFKVFNSEKEQLGDLKFPLIIKPLAEGSSKGIKDDCVVYDEKKLKKKVSEIIKKYKQPALVEEFLDGREFTVGIIGNGKEAKVLPIIELNFDFLPKNAAKIDSYEAKWIWDDGTSKIDPLICPAKLDKNTKKAIEDVALKAFNVLGCKDWARLDIRFDKDNQPNIIEVNSLPGIIPDPKENSRLPRAAYAAGMSYEELLGKVIDVAGKRHSINIK
ncbi:MAG: ATP-grasp domain-containing protein [Nanoarchaeota archaeon]|nr:ATP-grasp domain-containing protein [Nanoarchaeota archaeon]